MAKKISDRLSKLYDQSCQVDEILYTVELNPERVLTKRERHIIQTFAGEAASFIGLMYVHRSAGERFKSKTAKTVDVSDFQRDEKQNYDIHESSKDSN